MLCCLICRLPAGHGGNHEFVDGLAGVEALPPETWCWVRFKDGSVFPAKRDPRSKGGWTNADTWEDFWHEVVAFAPLPAPP